MAASTWLITLNFELAPAFPNDTCVFSFHFKMVSSRKLANFLSKERIVAHVSHEPRRNFVRILMGDRVRVTVSARDRTRGRITRRQQ